MLSILFTIVKHSNTLLLSPITPSFRITIGTSWGGGGDLRATPIKQDSGTF